MRLQLRAKLGQATALVAAAAAWLGVSGRAGAQVAELAPRTTVFIEPSKTSKLTVINPGADLQVKPTEWLDIHAGYHADIVSGATESLKGGRLSPVDIVSSATKFKDTRHLVSGGFGFSRDNTKLSATYAYGTESDYRSNAFSIQSGTSFLQKNTELTLAYGRGFDRVCTSGFVSSGPYIHDIGAPSHSMPRNSTSMLPVIFCTCS